MNVMSDANGVVDLADEYQQAIDDNEEIYDSCSD